jgi:hypothetical protein
MVTAATGSSRNGRYRNDAGVEIQNLADLKTTRCDFSYAEVADSQPMI